MSRWIPALIAVLAAAPAAAELYKWVDADGNVHYTDTPPPANAKKTERKKLGDKPTAQAVPYSLQQATKNFPVTFYTYADCGEICDRAAALLAKRGIPHTTRDPMDPATRQELLQLTKGEKVAPVLTVGSQTLTGFEEGAWNAALDTAGYPSTPIGPAPQTATPAQAPEKN